MANRIRDSFDFYGAVAEGVGIWTSMGTGTLSATTRFGVGQAFLGTTTLNAISLNGALGANSTTIFLTFAHSQAAALTANAFIRQAFQLYDGTTVQCSVAFLENGTINFYRGASVTLLGSYVGAFSGGGAWSHFQVKIVINDATGSFEVRKNGNSANDFTLTGVDNKITANAYANKVDLKCETGGALTQAFDDMWIFDDAVVAGEPSDWIGDVRALQVMPNSDSSIALSRSAGATNFSNVDELINSSVDYVFGSTAGLTDEYGNAGLAIVPDAILGVTARAIAFKTDAGPRTVGLRIRSGATVVDSPGTAIGTVAQSVKHNQDLNPNTGLAWTAAEIAAMLHGPRIVT